MKRWILAAGLLLLTLALPGVCATPDFAWNPECAQLSEAQQKWQAAYVIPPKEPQTATPQPFDTAHLRRILAAKSFSESPYLMLSDAMRRSRMLEESDKLYKQALEQCRPANADDLAKSFNKADIELGYSIALASALARAGIARKMAVPESMGYCFQAMESAIDTLAAAAKRETDKQRRDSLMKLREKLFAVWEQAQRTRDMGLIRDLDLLGAFDEVFPQHAGGEKLLPAPNK